MRVLSQWRDLLWVVSIIQEGSNILASLGAVLLDLKLTQAIQLQKGILFYFLIVSEGHRKGMFAQICLHITRHAQFSNKTIRLLFVLHLRRRIVWILGKTSWALIQIITNCQQASQVLYFLVWRFLLMLLERLLWFLPWMMSSFGRYRHVIFNLPKFARKGSSFKLQ